MGIIRMIRAIAYVIAGSFAVATVVPSVQCAWMVPQQHSKSNVSFWKSSSSSLFQSTNGGSSTQTRRHSALSSSAVTTTTVTSSSSSSSSSSEHNVVGSLFFLLPHDCRTKKSKYGSLSPVEPPTLYDAATHLARKTNFFTNNRLHYEIIILSNDGVAIATPTASNHDENVSNDATMADPTIWTKLCQAEIVIAMGISNTFPLELEYVQRLFEFRRTIAPPTLRHRLCHWALDCGGDSPSPSKETEGGFTTGNHIPPPLVGPYDPQQPTLRSDLAPWTAAASGRRLYTQLAELFSRYTSDDFCYGLVVFLHLFSGHEIDWVKYQTDASWEKGPIQNAKEFFNMMTKCGDCIVPCIKDKNCRECLSKMSQLDPRDQVTSYRTLVSYESDLLTNISRCLFTKKNIFQCDAQIPTYPPVHPIPTFRNQPLTEEMGLALLVGHLSNEDTALSGNLQRNVSWMVACGANVAYDQFPNQHQLFYPAAKGRDMWYDPFFRVVTLDGRHIWCHRHYKVRPGRTPGTFRFSTSDNGVTSDERWTILGAADDLSWLVVHYAGAAKTVGLQYLGGLLCTPDGTLPNGDSPQWNAIWQCLQNAGIQPWELTMVDNRNDTPNVVAAGLPPLEYYRGAIWKSRQRQITIAPPSPRRE